MNQILWITSGYTNESDRNIDIKWCEWANYIYQKSADSNESNNLNGHQKMLMNQVIILTSVWFNEPFLISKIKY